MEVHAHTHSSPATGGAARKKWTHYFWEFLMLFLAVFCGFLAENQREHMVEHSRERNYMQSQYSDLKKDTAFNRRFKNYLARVYYRLDSIQNMINTRQYIADPVKFYALAARSRTVQYFESYNSAYEQLKSSGNLRLIRKKGLADSLVDYYSMIQERVSTQESRYLQATENIATAMWDVLDAKYYVSDSLQEGISFFANYTVENATLENVNEEKLLKYKNLCYEKMLMIPTLRSFVLQLNEQATRLLLGLKDESHFD